MSLQSSTVKTGVVCCTLSHLLTRAGLNMSLPVHTCLQVNINCLPGKKNFRCVNVLLSGDITMLLEDVISGSLLGAPSSITTPFLLMRALVTSCTVTSTWDFNMYSFAGPLSLTTVNTGSSCCSHVICANDPSE